MRRFVASHVALLLVAFIAAPASAQSYDFATLGFRFEAPASFDVVQEGTKVTASTEGGAQTVEIQPFAVNDRDASRRQRVGRWFELQGYAFDGADEERGDGSIVVTGEGGDGSSFVMVRDVYVDSDGGLRVIVHADPHEMDAALALARGIVITDPGAVMNAGRVAGRID